MDYEKLHKDTITKLQEMVNSGKITAETARNICADFTPVSEDERIRKELIKGISKTRPNTPFLDTNITREEAIAWLEKQGTPYTKRDIDDAYLKGVTNTKNEIEKQYEVNYQIRKDIATFIFNYRSDIKDWAKWMDYLGIKVSLIEKQGEQKPIDKVKPKFKVGEVPDIENWHKWTIADAKDGDVLADDRAILLFRSIGNRNWKNVISYYAILETNLNNRFSISDDEEYWGKVEDCELKPASKGWRDFFFQKMKEAGCWWDAEKKELKKIEQKPAECNNSILKDKLLELFQRFRWYCKDEIPTNGDVIEYVDAHIQELIDTVQNKPWSEEDEKMLNDILMCGEHHCYLDAGNIAWLKSLKDRALPQTKQEWSEEDKDKLNRIYSILCQAADTHAFSTTCRLIGDRECIELQDFLKSLRPQNK